VACCGAGVLASPCVAVFFRLAREGAKNDSLPAKLTAALRTGCMHSLGFSMQPKDCLNEQATQTAWQW
jgi:hypothetical protein